MKIEKFNEGVKKEYFICMTISQNTNEIQTFGIFETEKDMDNWLINSANEYLPRTSAKVGENGIEEDQNGKPIITDVIVAINFIQNYYDENVYYQTSKISKNIKLKYNVDTLIDKKKFNL